MKKILLNFMLILLFSYPLFAQEKEQNSIFKNYSSSLFDQKENAFGLFFPVDKKIVSTAANLSSQSSAVNIEQIGNYNSATVTSNTTKAVINVSQNGNYNDYFLTAYGDNLTKDIIQKGNNNKIHDFSNAANNNVNTQMIQSGNNQSIRSFGSNSLSQNMKVVQKGNEAAVVIINYK